MAQILNFKDELTAARLTQLHDLTRELFGDIQIKGHKEKRFWRQTFTATGPTDDNPDLPPVLKELSYAIAKTVGSDLGKFNVDLGCFTRCSRSLWPATYDDKVILRVVLNTGSVEAYIIKNSEFDERTATVPDKHGLIILPGYANSSDVNVKADPIRKLNINGKTLNKVRLSKYLRTSIVYDFWAPTDEHKAYYAKKREEASAKHEAKNKELNLNDSDSDDAVIWAQK